MTTTIDPSRVEAFAGQALQEAGAATHVALAALGDRLGLYRAMADAQPVGAAELAGRTGTHERYVREWLAAQAASGVVEYDPGSARFRLPPEHAALLARDDAPVDLAGLFHLVSAAVRNAERLERAFRTGEGVGWHEHHDGLFCGTERFFGARYRAQLVDEWLPALPGVTERLRAGARVADVGCGHGAAAILIAQAFPRAGVIGYDVHPESVAVATRRAREAGVADRVRFEVASAQDYPARDLDLVCALDALHDMGDPIGAARHVRRSLRPDGAWLVVEPYAADRLEENLTPLGRLAYGVSTLVCTPGSLSQDGRAGLGTQAGEARLREAIGRGGFRSVACAARTPFNLVLDARP